MIHVGKIENVMFSPHLRLYITTDAVESISDSDLMYSGLRAEPTLSASHQSVPAASLRVHAK